MSNHLESSDNEIPNEQNSDSQDETNENNPAGGRQVENNNLLEDLKADHRTMSTKQKAESEQADDGSQADGSSDGDAVFRHDPAEHFETDLQAASREKGSRH